MKTKMWLIPAAFVLLAGGMQTSAFASPRGDRGGMHSGSSERGEIHEGYRGSDRNFGNSGRGEIQEGSRGGRRDRDFGRSYGPQIYLGPSLGWGWGWGWNSPWTWGPYYYPYPSVTEVRRVDYGTLKFKVKPKDTQIYVDKKYIGTVNSLDHDRAYMKEGNHEIVLKAPDGKTIDRNVYVAPGKKITIKYTL